MITEKKFLICTCDSCGKLLFEDGEWVELITGEKYTPTHWRQITLE